MTKFGFLLVLLLAEALAEEQPDPIFRAVGGELELGFCYAVDYILLYKRTVDGKQLLGNSSSAADVSPEAYRGRISPTNILNQLFGIQVVNLTDSDSGVFIRECWKDNVIVNHHEHYLYMCDEEVSSEQIHSESDEGADLECDLSGSNSATIRWYRDANAGYKTSLFLDTERSLEPLLEEMQGVLQVRDEGSSLHISEEGLKDSRHFTCLVMEGDQCKSFQNIQLPDSNGIDVQTVYYSVKERAVLPCFSDSLNARLIYWKTPFGRENSTTPSRSEMYISTDEDTGDYSLIIPSITVNHFGEYKCSTNLAEYFITVCTELESDEIYVSEGNKVTLGCTSPTEEPTNIQWYHQTEPELEEQLIYDSGDPSLNMSANLHIEDTSLTITEITEEEGGTYWCVVLLDNSDDYSEELFVEGEGENSDETNEDDYDWLGEEENTDKCILKQVIQLKVQSKPNLITTKTPQHGNIPPTSDATHEPKVKSGLVPGLDTEPEPESGTSQYAVIGGVVVTVLVVAIVIASVVVVKLKAKRKAAQNHATLSAQQKEATASQPFISLKECNP